MNITKLHPSGGWQISGMVDGYLVTRTYYGYTRREACAMFRRDTKAMYTSLSGGTP